MRAPPGLRCKAKGKPSTHIQSRWPSKAGAPPHTHTPTPEQVSAAAPASALQVVPADAPEADISAGTSPAAAPTSPAGLQAANEALKAAAAVAAAAAADAAAERAGVTLCRQHARVAVWAEDASISTEPRLHEYEARCSSKNWAAWALNAAALDQLGAEDSYEAVQRFCTSGWTLPCSVKCECRPHNKNSILPPTIDGRLVKRV